MFLTVAMIVKDEEQNLPRCLDSLKSLGKIQLVIVDTGSTDRTVEIAQRYGAEVFHHPWEGSFSIARNQAFQYVKGEWALIIDADEVIKSGGEHIQHMLKKSGSRADVGGAVVQMQDMNGDRVSAEWLSIRLVKMTANPRYENIYHNTCVHDGGHALLQGVVFHHFGYADPDVLFEKIERTKQMIFSEIEKNGPGNYRGFFYLAHQSAKLEQYKEAVEYGVIYRNNAKDRPEFNKAIYHLIVQCAMKLEDKDMVDEWLAEAIKVLPTDIDIAYDTAIYGQSMGVDTLLIEGGNRYMRAYDNWENNLTDLGNRWNYSRTPEQLKKICIATAEAYIRQAAKLNTRAEGMQI